MYPPDLVEAVLSHCDIVEIISSYLNVIKKGKEFKAVCPFHADTDPSLMISKEKQIFKCFVCGEGGNAISFVKKYEKISFDEAVRKVAELSNFSDPRLLKQVSVVKVNPSLEPIYKCINDLQTFYTYGLSVDEAQKAREYLANRHIDEDQIKKFGIGFSPIDGESTIKYLQAKGHSLKSIEGTGIALSGTNAKDHNAGRITFALTDPYGQVVGFSARRIIEDDTGKYINSPEGPIFHKSSILYNYHRAKDAARHEGFIYVFEGFMDVLALDKAGKQNAVAIMGTALPKEQIALLKRLNCEIRLCLDGDDAGQRAMMKNIEALQAQHINFRIVSNPKDLRDPDEILQDEGPEKLLEMLNNLVDPYKFQLSYYLNTKKLETIEDKKAVIKHFIPIIQSISSDLERDDYVAKLAIATGFETSTIYRQLGKFKNSSALTENENNYQFASKFGKQVIKRTRFDKLKNAEQHVLYYMLKELDAIRYFENNINSFYDQQLQTISNYIIDYYETKGGVASASLLMGNIEASEEENAEKLKDIITTLLLKESTWPSYSSKEIEALNKVIKEEKEKIYQFNELNSSMNSGDSKERSKSVDVYISQKKTRYKS